MFLRSALGDHGIAGRHVRGLGDRAEAGAKRVVREVVEISAIQNVVNLPAYFHVQAVGDLGVLH